MTAVIRRDSPAYEVVVAAQVANICLALVADVALADIPVKAAELGGSPVVAEKLQFGVRADERCLDVTLAVVLPLRLN